MHLVDIARERIEENYSRPLLDRLIRTFIAKIVSNPNRFRIALAIAQRAAPIARLLPGRWGAMARLAPEHLQPSARPIQAQVFPAAGMSRGRVALSVGCAQQILAPQINEATIRLLTRHGYDVVVADGAGCCGSLDHHLGRSEAAETHAAQIIKAWDREHASQPLDAIIVNTSGCGTTIKDYGFIYREHDELAEPASRVSGLTKDISEFLSNLNLEFVPDEERNGLRVSYHGHCSLQHGQSVRSQPIDLLRSASFDVSIPTDDHFCCGSAGSYSLLQPDLAMQLRDKKVATLMAAGPTAITTGNIGCMSHLAPSLDAPVLHIAELLDWATGGPKPRDL
jgi:glycolate oxidase iron-sulfur subunit